MYGGGQGDAAWCRSGEVVGESREGGEVGL